MNHVIDCTQIVHFFKQQMLSIQSTKNSLVRSLRNKKAHQLKTLDQKNNND